MLTPEDKCPEDSNYYAAFTGAEDKRIKTNGIALYICEICEYALLVAT